MVQDLHNSEISVNFLPGMDNVLVTVSICIPKQVTEVSAGTNFLCEIFRPRSSNNWNKNQNELCILDGKPVYIRSSI